MQNCKDIKDIILTDYIDNQLDAAAKIQLESHLSQCAACQSFAMEAKSHLKEPFDKASCLDVSPHVWESIKGKIVQKETSKGFSEGVRDWLESFSFPKLAPLAVSFVMLVFVSSAVVLNVKTQQAKDQEQGLYVEYMLSSAVSNQRDNPELGTPLEKYFL